MRGGNPYGRVRSSPWKSGTAFDVAKQCFVAWLRNRSGAGAPRDAVVGAATCFFMEQHSASHF